MKPLITNLGILALTAAILLSGVAVAWLLRSYLTEAGEVAALFGMPLIITSAVYSCL